MDLLAPIVDVILCLRGPISRQIGYIKNLNQNMATLNRESDELKCMHDEVQARVDDAESAGMTRLPLVQNWLEDVGRTAAEVVSIRLEMDRGRTGCCCGDLNSRRRLGKRVIRRKSDVERLRGKGNFSEVAKSPGLSDQKQVPQELEQQSSSKEILEEISHCLNNEEVGVICVWGMGGIGKTTLMKEIYNRFNATKDFQQVIWVTVSKDLDLEVIQQKIASKLGLKFDGAEGIEVKRDRLYGRLRNVTYLLILDDLWRGFSLDDVGIPQPNEENHCKIVITTRLNEVNNAMEADRRIKVKPLGSEEAWNLFCSKTENVILLPEIRPLADMVVEECDGLPLAIITVGRAMRLKDKRELWQHALRALKGSAPEIRGMEGQVFLQLKLSYDCIEDPKIQSCFLYCSLYPEDYEIYAGDLVRYWAFEEGLVNNVSSLDDALNKGHDILEKLMDACLLENGTSSNKYVRMHDLLRDLAVWITSPSSSFVQASKFLVKAGVGLEQPPEEKMWEGMKRISLMQNEITELHVMPTCPDLVSLFLGNNEKLQTIGDGFFQFMPKLQILDLGSTAIKSLPPSLSLLVDLRVLVARHCKNLQEMQPLGDLKELQLLDLSYSGIENLPGGIASLAKLRCLDLSHTKALTTIPCNLISRLTCLEDLRLRGWVTAQMMNMDTWREVATLPSLASLQMELPGLGAFTADDLNHPMWSRLARYCVQFGVTDAIYEGVAEREVRIFDCQDFPRQVNFKSLIGNAEELHMSRCQGLESLSQIIAESKSLKRVELREAQGLKCCIDWREVGENTALGCLEELDLLDLPSLQKLFDVGPRTSFGRLTSISVIRCPQLACIFSSCNGGPQTGFRQLRYISISGCPKLRCIFSSTMLQHLQQLEMLEVHDCEEIEEIAEGGPFADMAQLRLINLDLIDLPKLTTIWRQHLVLTSVTNIQVADCPVLKKLPILSSDMQKIGGEIRGGRKWWERMEWEDDHSKSLFSTIYVETVPEGEDVEEASKMEAYDDEEASEGEPAKEVEAASDLLSAAGASLTLELK